MTAPTSMAAPARSATPLAPPARASSPRWCTRCARAAAGGASHRCASAAARPRRSPSKSTAECPDAPRPICCAPPETPAGTSMKISEARAVVTGGASGLGNAVARHIVSAGGRVTLLDVQEGPGQAAAAALGAGTSFAKCDVTSETEVNAAMDSARSAMGGINLLVNCAGVIGAGRVLGKNGPMAGDFFTRVVHINLIGTFLCDKAAAAIMQLNTPNADGERGVIVHTSSVAAYEGQIGQAAYSATKAAVAGMTLPIAREFAQFGIRVMSLAPGIFGTPMLGAMPQDVQDSLGKQVPFPPRLGRPEEFAAMVQTIFEVAYLNGETIRLDGAIRMQPK